MPTPTRLLAASVLSFVLALPASAQFKIPNAPSLPPISPPKVNIPLPKPPKVTNKDVVREGKKAGGVAGQIGQGIGKGISGAGSRPGSGQGMGGRQGTGTGTSTSTGTNTGTTVSPQKPNPSDTRDDENEVANKPVMGPGGFLKGPGGIRIPKVPLPKPPSGTTTKVVMVPVQQTVMVEVPGPFGKKIRIPKVVTKMVPQTQTVPAVRK